jgi:hypothetical protein
MRHPTINANYYVCKFKMQTITFARLKYDKVMLSIKKSNLTSCESGTIERHIINDDYLFRSVIKLDVSKRPPPFACT